MSLQNSKQIRRSKMPYLPTRSLPRRQRSSGYGRPWRRLRDQVLFEERICRLCGRPGQADDEVDHIVSKKRGGRDVRTNLQRLCGECHRWVSLHYDGGYGNPMREGKPSSRVEYERARLVRAQHTT